MWPIIISSINQHLKENSSSSRYNSKLSYSVIGANSLQSSVTFPSDGNETPLIILNHSIPQYILVANNGFLGAQALIQVLFNIIDFGYDEHGAEPGRFYLTNNGVCIDDTLNPEIAKLLGEFVKLDSIECVTKRALVQLVEITTDGFKLGHDPLANSITSYGY